MSEPVVNIQENKRKVISISFYKAIHSNEIDAPFRKLEKLPFLQIEVLDDACLHFVAVLLFNYCLEEELDEALYEHLWRFQPMQSLRSETYAFNTSLPILSNDMGYKALSYSMEDKDDDFSKLKKCRIQEGTDLLFFYDEGSPTRVFVTIDRVSDIPDGKAITDYPLKKEPLQSEEVLRIKQRISEMPILSITMDEAYPFLSKRLMKERNVELDIGHGCGFDKTEWARIWGGGMNPAFTYSLECREPFNNMNEAWLCFEKGIEKQISPDHPTMTKAKRVRIYDGEIRYVPIGESYEDHHPSEIVVRPYPTSCHPSDYAEEYMSRQIFSTYSTESTKEITFYRNAFNFALPDDWRTNPDNMRFSFAKQFPKCNAWLMYPSKTAYWFQIDNCVLKAIKGKNALPKKSHNVQHYTLKHDNLQFMFSEMETLLVLPKSWKLRI